MSVTADVREPDPGLAIGTRLRDAVRRVPGRPRWKRRTSRAAIRVAVFIAGIVLTATTGWAEDSPYQQWHRKGVAALKKRAYDRALEAFKAAVNADPGALDGYFNAGSVARHLRRCRDVLLYFRGFLYLSPGTEDDKTARAAIRECERGPQVGRLSVRSEASGAEVFLDGVLVGRVPLNDLTVIPGDYRVEIRHPDYEGFAQSVTVASGETASVAAVLVMKPAFGYLQVVTVPADGVTVYLDDQEVGVTPVETLKLKVGKVLVRFEKPGYDPWIRAVTILKDRTHRLEATLEAASGSSETGASPGGAAIPDGGR